MTTVLRLEIATLVRSRAVVVSLAAFFVAGLAALEHGRGTIDAQRSVIAESPRLQAAEHARVLSPLPPTANAGDQLYYLFFHTVREPSAWAAVSVGQRDVHAYNLKVRMLALQGQLYGGDLGNPLLAAFGQFDLAFVFVVVAPLLLIAVSFNAQSAEIESGRWRLVLAQPTAVWKVLATKYLARFAVVWMPVALLLGVATLRLGLSVDTRWWLVLGVVTLYLVVWTLAAVAVNALKRSSEVNALALLGVFVVWTAVGPGLISATASLRWTLPEALELTVQQRQAYHGAWDEPLPVVMDAFYERYPEWRTVPVSRDRYSNAWYYAMQQRGDEAARQAARAYREGLEVRDRWVGRWSWLCPPAAVERWLSRAAGTDLEAYLAYVDSVARYHETLKRHFFPAIFHNATVAQVDWNGVPRHWHRD